MKNLLALASIFSFIFLTGCKKIDKLTQFNLEYNEEVTMPSSMGIGLPLNLFTPEISSNSEYSFSQNDTRKDLVEKILLKEVVLTIKTPDNSDFSFLKSIKIFISADGLDEMQIAFIEDIPNTVGNRLDLETSDSDLKEYIKKDNFKLRVETVSDESFSPDHTVNVYTKFFVDAKVLGL